VTVAGSRYVSHRAKVVWEKRKLFRKIGTQEKCGPRKEFEAAEIRATRCAKVARRKGRTHEGPLVEQGRRKNKTWNKFEIGTRTGWSLGRRQLTLQKGTNGTGNRHFKEQLRLGNERSTSGIYKKTIGLEIVKRAEGISSRLRRIKDWTWWKGRPLPKWKKELQIQQKLVM
jgi:hypothetical protein